MDVICEDLPLTIEEVGGLEEKKECCHGLKKQSHSGDEVLHWKGKKKKMFYTGRSLPDWTLAGDSGDNDTYQMGRDVAKVQSESTSGGEKQSDGKRHFQIQGVRAVPNAKKATEEEESSSSVLRHMCILTPRAACSSSQYLYMYFGFVAHQRNPHFCNT